VNFHPTALVFFVYPELTGFGLVKVSIAIYGKIIYIIALQCQLLTVIGSLLANPKVITITE